MARPRRRRRASRRGRRAKAWRHIASTTSLPVPVVWPIIEAPYASYARTASRYHRLAPLALAAPCSATTPPVFLKEFGSPGSGPGELNNPRGMGIDQAGDIYVADTGNSRIVVFSSDGVFLSTWGSYGFDPGQFYGPTDVAVAPNGDIYVVDGAPSVIDVFDPQQEYIRSWHTIGTASPQSIQIDGTGQYVYISALAVNGLGMMYVYTTTGTPVASWISAGSSKVMPGFSFGVGPSGSIYTSDNAALSVSKFTASGGLLARWGTYGNGAWAIHISSWCWC